MTLMLQKITILLAVWKTDTEREWIFLMIFASGDVGCSVTQDVQNSSNTFIVKAIMSVKDSKHVEPLNQYIQNTLDREPCTIQWGL